MGDDPAGLILTKDESHLLVVSLKEAAVYAIDRVSRNVSATTLVGSGAFAIELSPEGDHAYVANYTDNTIDVLDATPGSPTFLKVLTTISN